MHELAIAQNIKESVERELETHAELKKILCIKVVIGGMHAVVPEALRFNFSIVCRDSRLADAELAITEIPVKGDCGSCGKDFEIRDHLFLCPLCGSADISIRGGNEFFIESITGEG